MQHKWLYSHSISTLKPHCWFGYFITYYESHLGVHPASLSRNKNVKMGKLPELVSMGYQSTASYLRFQCDFLWTRSAVRRKCFPNDLKTRQSIALLLPCTWLKVQALWGWENTAFCYCFMDCSELFWIMHSVHQVFVNYSGASMYLGDGFNRFFLVLLTVLAWAKHLVCKKRVLIMVFSR